MHPGLQEVSKVAQRAKDEVHQLEAKLSQSSQLVEQLEAALLLCRNEIAEHISSMDRTRHKFEAELGKREQAVSTAQGAHHCCWRQ